MKNLILILLSVTALFAQTNTIQETPLGIARIVRVYDGDTFYGDLYNLPDIFGKNIGIRLLGIDTPELNSQDSCARVKAKAARACLDSLLKCACRVELRNICRDKYFRIDAIVYADTLNVNQEMINRGHAKAYTGEGPRPTFTCAR